MFNFVNKQIIFSHKIARLKPSNFSLPLLRVQYSTASEIKLQNNENIWGLDRNILSLVQEDLILYENFISESEEQKLMEEIDPIFKRRRYQFDHWDGAIQGYKETEKEVWNERENEEIVKRIQKIAFPKCSVPLTHIHILDLCKTGHIKPHIDSVKFCGNIIAGLSLLSSSVMRFLMEENKAAVDVLLQRRSLYIMKGIVRYKFTHEILSDAHSFFKGYPVPRQRRVSIICRNEPQDESQVV